MQSDQVKWDTRHQENPIIGEPLEILKKYITHITPKENPKALDIACGMGRNSRFMRDCGFCVESVDISDFAITSLQNEHNIHAFCADLDTFKIPPQSFDLICNSYFLERRLFPFIREGLKKDGILVFETFAKSERESQNAFASDSSHLLHKNELLHAFLDLEILFYEETLIQRTQDSLALVARLVGRARE